MLQYFIITFIFCQLIFGELVHGVGLQMTTNGTAVYYKPLFRLSNYTQSISNLGFHLDKRIQTPTYFGFETKYQNIFIDISTGYRIELFQESIAGTFRPIFTIQGGGTANIDSFSKSKIQGVWELKYSAGTGFQFYNGRILNEIMLNYYQSPSIMGNAAFQLVMYWE